MLTYRETFDDRPGGWYGWNHYGASRLELREGAAISRSPWWVDYNHAPPGAGYLHILYVLNTKDGDSTLPLAGPNRFVNGGYSTDFTNARLTLRLRGEVDAKRTKLLLLTQADVPGTRVNSVLSAQPIAITPDWSEPTIVCVPEDSQWTCLGSRHDRIATYGAGPIAAVLRDVNLDILLVLFPLDVAPAEAIQGDPHRLRAGRDYPVDQSRLPSGHVMLDEVRIEFAGLRAKRCARE